MIAAAAAFCATFCPIKPYNTPEKVNRAAFTMLSRCLGRSLCVSSGAAKRNVRYTLTTSQTPQEEEKPMNTKVQGWVRAVRKMKHNIFIDVVDGTHCKPIQVVLPKENLPQDLTYGSSIVAEGPVGSAPNGLVEVQAKSINVLGTCNIEEGYPFYPKKQYSMEYVREYLHLRPRTRTFSSVLRLRSIASLAVGDHLRERGFINVHTPVITSNDCEGAGELFEVKPNATLLKEMEKENIPMENAYFDTKASLTVSAQLHLEAVARALTKVYTFGPAFRAENSKSRVHLSEFYMLEAEMAFIDSIDHLMDEIELLIKEVTKSIIAKGSDDFVSIGATEPKWLGKSFIRMTYDKATEILEKNTSRLTFPMKYGSPFSKEHELFLVEYSGGIPVFITNWPKDQKAFYMKECVNNSQQVDAIDLLAPDVGELVGGGIRETDYKKLEQKLPSPQLAWYLELRKFGNVPTAGFGLGFERFLQCILCINNIKDAIPFPRWPHHCQM